MLAVVACFLLEKHFVVKKIFLKKFESNQTNVTLIFTSSSFLLIKTSDFVEYEKNKHDFLNSHFLVLFIV